MPEPAGPTMAVTLPAGASMRYVAKHVDAGAEITDSVEEIVRDDSRHGAQLSHRAVNEEEG